jgi:hypothetical protein
MVDAVFLLPVVGAIVWLGVSVFQGWQRNSRRRAVQAVAGALDFDFATVDSYGLADLPFTLFQQGIGKAQLVISGTHKGQLLHIFDYEHQSYPHSRDAKMYTCAVLTIPTGCPWLQLVHETALTRVAEQVIHADLDLEYDDFNREFVVSCADRNFAFCLLDGQMMEWLVGALGIDRLEIIGPWILLANEPVDPSRWKELGEWLDAFRLHIPPVVYSSYPPASAPR